MVNTAWVNADHGRHLHPLADHVTKLRNFTKEQSRFFSISIFTSVKASTNSIVCLMISQKLHTKVAQTSNHVIVDTR